MGSMGAMAMKDEVDEGDISLDNALIWHLRSNHYPPVPLCMLEPCKQAIKLCNDGEWDELVQLPEGVTWHDEDVAPAWAIVEGHHLMGFLDCEEE